MADRSRLVGPSGGVRAGAWTALLLCTWLGLAPRAPEAAAEDAPAAAAAPTKAKELVELIRPLVGDPAWKHVSFPLPAVVLRKQLRESQKALTEDLLKELQDGATLVSAVPGEPARVTVMTLRFTDPQQAGAALGALRDAAKDSAEALSEGVPAAWRMTFDAGAGPQGTLPGYVLHRDFAGDVTSQHVVQLGAFVVMLSLEGTGAPDRAAQDRVLVRAGLWVTDPARAAAEPALTPPPFERAFRSVLLRVTGPGGAAVNSAALEVDAGATSTKHVTLRKGQARLSVPRKESVTLSILRPKDEAGEPLPFAPVLVRPFPQEGEEWTIALEPAVELRGLVERPGGEPAGHVRVMATAIHEGPVGSRSESTSWRVAQATTEADGTFVLHGLARGALYRLRAMDGEQLLPSEETEVRPGTEAVTLRLLEAAEVVVTVLDADGGAVPGAIVSAWMPGTSGIIPTATSDRRGRARLQGLPADKPCRLQVEAPEDREDVAGYEEDGWLPAPTVVRLPRGWVTQGRVLDPTGAPTRATVVLRHGHGGESFHETDDQGRFRFTRLPPGSAHLRAVHVNDQRRRALHFGDPPGVTEVAQGTNDVVLTLEPSRVVHIRVLGPSGAPVAGVRVTLGTPSSNTSTTFPGHDVRVSATAPTTTLTIAQPEDEDGRRLPFKRYVGPIPAPKPGGVELRLGLGSSLRGRVLGPDGAPVAGAQVRWAPPRPDGAGPLRDAWRASETDAEGRFLLEGVDEGRVYVDVEAGGEHPGLPARLVEPGASPLELRVPKGEPTEITVLDEAGQPVRDARIKHHRVAQPAPGTEEYTGHTEVRTDAEGRARLGVFVGDQLLDVEVNGPPGRPGLLKHRARLAGPRVERVVLKEGRIVRGRVLHANGAPAPEAQVVLRALGPKADPFVYDHLARCDAQGRFVTRPFPKGRSMLQAYAAEDERAGPGVVVEADEESVTLRLAPPDVDLVLTFQPADARPSFYGGPAAHPLRPVREVEEPHHLWQSPALVLVEAATGRAVLRVPPGPTRVWIPPTEDDPRCALLTVDAPGEVAIELSTAPAITVTVVLPAEATDVDVHAHGPFDHHIPARATPTPGRYTIVGLPEGTWKVCVDARVGPVAWHATADVATGGTVELVAQPGSEADAAR
jgi:protocatechuate 3,4-dioxygenase beta subunit